jgi:hypothetical protein
MTPEERAENIKRLVSIPCANGAQEAEVLRKIAAQIAEAVEEARNEYQELRCCNAARTRAEAYEDAAKTLEDAMNGDGMTELQADTLGHFARKFRARAKQVKREGGK